MNRKSRAVLAALLLCVGAASARAAAPSQPITPVGPQFSVTGVQVHFTSTSFDSDGNKIRLRVDWGDGTTDFTVFFFSGEYVDMIHTYEAEGVHEVLAQAIDETGAASVWSDPRAIDVAEASYRYGNVDSDDGSPPDDVLFVGASFIDPVTRETEAYRNFPLTVYLAAPPAGPAHPQHAVWGWLSKPTSQTDRSAPNGIGRFAINPLLNSCGFICPVFSANQFGRCTQVLCSTAEATGARAPGSVLQFPANRFSAGTTITFQGVVKDFSNLDNAPRLSITNAVIVIMVDL